jgi:two-component system, NtrC family, response regulator AtoC
MVVLLGPVADIVGSCPAMKDVKRRVREVCDRTLSGATPVVLLIGEIGTGKALIAKALHGNGARSQRPFVAVNCAALSPQRLREQLFGDSDAMSRGVLEAADGGTVFLEEVGAAPLDVQRDLLTAIEDKLIRRATREPIHVDVQFVAATRRDLASMVTRGEFRADLYHRLNVLALEVPPLRERGDDVIAIARQLLADLAAEHGIRAPELADDAVAALRRHRWPGNVRELRNELERIVLLVDDVVVRADHLHLPRETATVQIAGHDADVEVVISGERCPLEQLEREVIRQALVHSNGNISRAARYLAITRQTLLYRMKKYDFKSPSTSSEIAVVRSSH